MTHLLAHAVHEGHGLTAGLLHPLVGLDHLLAAVAVGMVGSRLGQRARTALPAMFVAGTMLGLALSQVGLSLPGVEPGIALSLVVLGLALAFHKARAAWPAAAIIGGFAIFHGQAHAAEQAASSGLLAYALGLCIATASLHAAGVGIASSASLPTRRQLALMRTLAALTFSFGAFKLVGSI